MLVPARSVLVCALALTACYRSAPPSPPAPQVAPVRPSPVRHAPCAALVTTLADAKASQQHGDVSTPRAFYYLSVLDLDIATGKTKLRTQIPLPEDESVQVHGAAIRGDEIALYVSGPNRAQEAWIDLRTRTLGRGAETSEYQPQMLRPGMLTSDGRTYYAPCSYNSLCRRKVWRRNEHEDDTVELKAYLDFNDMAVGGDELYALQAGKVTVFDLESGWETRSFTISATSSLRGVGVVGDDLVVASEGRVRRFDRKSGALRGDAPITLPEHLTKLEPVQWMVCAAPGRHAAASSQPTR